jgi:hypothetical protein
MKLKSIQNIANHFKQISAPRIAKRKQHKLLDIITIEARDARQDVRTWVALEIFSIGSFLWLTATSPALGADVTFQFQKVSDGTVPFDANNNPGNDSSDNNNRVRTLDVINYRWQYAVNNGSATNVVLQATVPPEQEFPSLPPVCQTGSGITVDPSTGNQTIACKIGTVSSGSSGSIDISGRILGKRRAPVNTFVGNNQTTSASGSLEADGVKPITNDISSITISAFPKADLMKDSAWVEGVAKDENGNPGVVIRYPITIAITGSGKGSEPLTSNINFTDQLIDRTTNQPVPGARLYTWATDGHSGCNWMGGDGYSWYSWYPHGKQGVNGWYGDPSRSVKDSGTWTCTQPGGAGTPINFTITGADTTGNSIPTKSYHDSALPANRSYLVSGTLHLWVPISTITAAGGQLNVRNTLSNLTTPSVSSQNNIEPDTTNNNYEHTLVATSGNFTSYYHDKWVGDSRWTPLPAMSAIYGGDGVVMPNQLYSSRLYMQNNGALPWEEAILCQAIDNKTQQFVEIPATPGQAVRDLSYGTASTNYAIEYGTGDYADQAAQKTATCRDGTVDSPDGWFTNINSVPGGIDKITKVRIRSLAPIPSNAVWDVVLSLKMRNTYLGTTTQIPIGVRVKEYSSFYIKNDPYGIYNGGGMPSGWRGAYYDADIHYYVGWGDRLTLTRAIVRVNKENVPNVEVKPALAGSRTSFVLKSTITSPINPAPVNPSVIVKDTLPAYLKYVAGSANFPPASIVNNTDGTTTITWDLGVRTPNQVIPDITFDADIRADAPNNASLINQAVIESPDDASLASARTDFVTLSIGNAAAFSIFKEVEQVLVEKEEQIVFNLFYANTGSSDVGSSRFIDIFPNAAIPRSPVSNYNGSLAFQSITGSNNESFEFTNRTPTNIDIDPDHSSNQPGGATQWCTPAQFGNTPGCPINNNEVTAVRINAPTFPKNSPTRKVTLTLKPTGNIEKNIYTNNFSGRATGLLGLLESNNVFAKVAVPANLLLVKRITAINGLPIDTIVDDPNSLNDNDPDWPANYLKGVINGGAVKPGDIIDYTIYYLSNGDRPVNNGKFCDLVPVYTSYEPQGFNGKTPLGLGSLPNVDVGIQFDKEGSTSYLTSISGDDVGSIIPKNADLSVYKCSGSNVNGAVVVNLGNVIHSGYNGTPSKAYGLVRFRAKIK